MSSDSSEGMMTEHTPGPWSFRAPNEIKAGLKTPGRSDGINTVAMVNLGGLNEPGGDPKANARLIAAGPDLLACLGDLLGLVTEGFHPEDIAVVRSVKEARAAIAKATGEAPPC